MKHAKKSGVILITAAVICLMTACGMRGTEWETEKPVETESSPMSENEVVQSTEPIQSTESESAEPESAEPESTELDADGTETSDKESSQTADVTAEPEPFTPVAGLSEDYADLEKRCFAYKGQIFILGESTLQDLIDGGIPFDESDLNNSGNNVNKNYETSRYRARINDYVSLQFTFINTTGNNISEAECLLHSVRWYSLYVPQPDYEDSMNEEITALISDAQDQVCFSFPLTLTKEQLLENNGNATEIDEYNNVEYQIHSEVYMGQSGYRFTFNKVTNQLEQVTISWLP